jgi:hypothetical protein
MTRQRFIIVQRTWFGKKQMQLTANLYIELKKIGVFASAVIKKQRYWPKYVPEDSIDDRMKDKEIGDVDALNGTIDGVPYNIMCMKDVDNETNVDIWIDTSNGGSIESMSIV